MNREKKHHLRAAVPASRQPNGKLFVAIAQLVHSSKLHSNWPPLRIIQGDLDSTGHSIRSPGAVVIVKELEKLARLERPVADLVSPEALEMRLYAAHALDYKIEGKGFDIASVPSWAHHSIRRIGRR